MSYQYLLAPCKKTFVSKPSFASLQGSCWRNSCQLIPLQRKTNRFPATCLSQKFGIFLLALPKSVRKKIINSPQIHLFPKLQKGTRPTFQKKNIPNVSLQPNKDVQKATWRYSSKSFPCYDRVIFAIPSLPELRRAVTWCRSRFPSDDRRHQPSGSRGMSSAVWTFGSIRWEWGNQAAKRNVPKMRQTSYGVVWFSPKI